MLRKAAVIMGINKPGHYTPLKSATSGAEQVAQWLKNEGYDVTCLTDRNGQVTAQMAREAISKYVTQPPRYNMLLIYFSGHGEYHARSDLWLFSGAPTNPNDAINLEGAIDLAKYSGIPNVVFISDACRSLPDTRSGSLIKGIDAFPSYSEVTNLSKIDYFKATSESQPAFEGEIKGQNQGFLTYALMSAYIDSPDEITREVIDGNENFTVVPNRMLEKFLQSKINEVIANKPGVLFQQIDACVPSDDDVYISRVIRSLTISAKRGRSKSGKSRGIIPPPTSVGDAASGIVMRSLNREQSSEMIQDETDILNRNPETVDMINNRMPNPELTHFESGCGFNIYGAQVTKAVCSKSANNDYKEWVEVVKHGNVDNNNAELRLWEINRAATLVVEFANGKCSILPALAGYIGHAIYEGDGLANVSFVPSSNSGLHEEYLRSKKEIDRFRALVSLAVKHNSFKVNSEREANSLAGIIRMGKAIDPTLGLYAAHAFSQAGNDKLVKDVIYYMRHDLGVDLFDVKLLALRQMNSAEEFSAIPFCPILTQTWNLLRPRGINLSPILIQAMPYLCNSLWTTFQPTITKSIMDYCQIGE